MNMRVLNYLTLLALGLIACCDNYVYAESASMVIDFSTLDATTGAELDSESIMAGMSGTPDMVSSIEVMNAHLRSTGGMIAGLWFDSPAENNDGYIKLNLNPSKYVHAIRVNFYGCECRNTVGSDNVNTDVEIKLNDKSTIETYKNPTNSAKVISITADDAIIQTITFKVPYSPESDYKSYNGCLQSIKIFFDEVEPENRDIIEKWSFNTDYVEGYLNTKLTLPTFYAQPEIAASLMELSSSDTDVASIENGEVILKKIGETIITASVGENMLFKPDCVSPASFILNVTQMNTSIEELDYNVSDNEIVSIYDIQGHRLNKTNVTGLYIVVRKDGKREKLIVR